MRHRVTAARHIGSPDRQNGDIGNEPLFPVVRDQPDMITSCGAEFHEPGSEILALGVELAVCGGVEGADFVFPQLRCEVRVSGLNLTDHFRYGFKHSILPCFCPTEPGRVHCRGLAWCERTRFSTPV